MFLLKNTTLGKHKHNYLLTEEAVVQAAHKACTGRG